MESKSPNHFKRKTKQFSMNYLPFTEQLTLLLQKQLLIYTRSLKSLILIFASPLILLSIVAMLQSFNNEYNEMETLKDHPEELILENTDLKCSFPSDCLSIGIGIIKVNVLTNKRETMCWHRRWRK